MWTNCVRTSENWPGLRPRIAFAKLLSKRMRAIHGNSAISATQAQASRPVNSMKTPIATASAATTHRAIRMTALGSAETNQCAIKSAPTTRLTPTINQVMVRLRVLAELVCQAQNVTTPLLPILQKCLAAAGSEHGNRR